MPPPPGTALADWWPTTQSMDLVEAPVERTAEAVLARYRSFSRWDERSAAERMGLRRPLLQRLREMVFGDQITLEWIECRSLRDAFELIDRFDVSLTRTLILPTRTRWTVLWNNSPVCSGYDSLCFCLTESHGLTTLHWSAHDDWTTTQSGSHYHWRAPAAEGMAERYVFASQEDDRWHFHQGGEPLPEEDVAGYAAVRVRDRLNEARLMELLGRLGAEPWNEAAYAFPGRVALITRPRPIGSVAPVRSPSEVCGRFRKGNRILNSPPWRGGWGWVCAASELLAERNPPPTPPFQGGER